MNTRFVKAALLSTVAGAALLSFSTGAFANAGVGTSAGPVTEAGETIGLALGAALPQGVYFVDTSSEVHIPGTNASHGQTGDVLVNIPVVAWSTPWDFAGGHIEAYAAAPEAAVLLNNTGSGAQGGASGLYNPALLVGEAWNLGNNIHFSNFVGGYAPVNQAGFAQDNGTNNVWTFNERAAVSYLADGYNITAHGIYGTSNSTNGYQRADYINVDFAALKNIGKWEIGPVAYYTADVGHATAPNTNPVEGNRQFALGGFVGYALGGVTVQAYATRDVADSEGVLFGGDQTRIFLRFVVPLGLGGK